MNEPLIERIDHTTVNVTDLKRAQHFYGEVLNLEEVPRPKSFDFPGAWYKAGESTIHIVVRDEPDPETTAHFALWAADLKKLASLLEQEGFELKWSAHKIDAVSRFFIRDPDGNLIEFQGSDENTGH